MTEWREVTLGDLCERVTVGHVGKMSDRYVDDGVPFLRSQNVKPFVIERDGMLRVDEAFHRKLAKSSLATGDVVVVRTGYPGTAAVVPRELDGSNCADLVVITPGEDLNPHVLAAVFNSAWGSSAVSGHLVGAAQQHFNIGSAKVMRLRLPARPEQDRIAEVLCAFHDLIENNRRRVEVLEEMARAIYREWFVQFRFPGHEDVPLVDSPLGPIPDGWTVRPLVEVADLTMGQSPKSEFYNSEGEGKPFHQGVADFGRHYPTHRKFCTVDARLAHDGDVLVSVRAPVGRINLADTTLVIGRGLAAVRSTTGQQSFLLASLREVFAEEDSMGGGTIFNAIGKRELEQVPVVQPPDALATVANDRLAPLFQLIRSLTFTGRELAAIRDLLLPKLVTGQIDVSHLDLDALTAAASA
jgi:type I restriction enzyme S subunit